MIWRVDPLEWSGDDRCWIERESAELREMLAERRRERVRVRNRPIGSRVRSA